MIAVLKGRKKTFISSLYFIDVGKDDDGLVEDRYWKLQSIWVKVDKGQRLPFALQYRHNPIDACSVRKEKGKQGACEKY